ncbi:MAG TPA: hypothetical protein PK297_11290 [Spirochaetota bacterium]|nr:hypothetical protein [Spirochaetota bacterium]
MNHHEAHELVVWLESRGLGSALANARVALEKTGDRETALDALLLSLDPSQTTDSLRRVLRRSRGAARPVKKNRSSDYANDPAQKIPDQIEVELLHHQPDLSGSGIRPEWVKPDPFVQDTDQAELPDDEPVDAPQRSFFRRFLFEGLGSAVIFITAHSIFGSVTHGNTPLSLIISLVITIVCWAAVLKE